MIEKFDHEGLIISVDCGIQVDKANVVSHISGLEAYKSVRASIPSFLARAILAKEMQDGKHDFVSASRNVLSIREYEGKHPLTYSEKIFDYWAEDNFYKKYPATIRVELPIETAEPLPGLLALYRTYGFNLKNEATRTVLQRFRNLQGKEGFRRIEDIPEACQNWDQKLGIEPVKKMIQACLSVVDAVPETPQGVADLKVDIKKYLQGQEHDFIKLAADPVETPMGAFSYSEFGDKRLGTILEEIAQEAWRPADHSSSPVPSILQKVLAPSHWEEFLKKFNALHGRYQGGVGDENGVV